MCLFYFYLRPFHVIIQFQIEKKHGCCAWDGFSEAIFYILLSSVLLGGIKIAFWLVLMSI